jgi:hypothetical protein
MTAESAVDVLEDAMRDESASLSARINSAVYVLQLAGQDPQPEMLDNRLMSSADIMLERMND